MAQISVELVTADGSSVHATEEENPELFCALHGEAGNFGVATSFTRPESRGDALSER